MKNNVSIVITILLTIGSFFLGMFYERRSNPTVIHDTIPQVINKIIEEKDSILRINDSITYKVITLEKTYEKTVDDIIRNNPDDDYRFFSSYLERFRGSNNSDSTEIR